MKELTPTPFKCTHRWRVRKFLSQPGGMWGYLEVWSFGQFHLTELSMEMRPHIFPFSVFWCTTKYFKIWYLLSITFSLSQPLDPKMSQTVILLWIKAAPKEGLATLFILQARSGIKIANLLKYSFGPHLLECGDVAAASNTSWAFFSHLRPKKRTSSQGLSKKKAPMETRRVSTKMETSRLVAISAQLQVRIPVTSASWSLVQAEFAGLVLTFHHLPNNFQPFHPHHSLS